MSQNGDRPQNPRVIMWCVPRSVSTAFTKCMSFVDGADVWLEPYAIAKAIEEMFDKFRHDEHGEKLPIEVEGNEALYRELAEKLTLGGDVNEYKLERLSPLFLKSDFDSMDPEKKFVFIKDMAVGMPPSWYQYLPNESSGYKHFFLIRHPVKVYKSYRKGIADFMEDISEEHFAETKIEKPTRETLHVINSFQAPKGTPAPKEGTPYFFKAVHELWTYIKKNVDEDPVVLDIDDLLDDPSTMLPVLCKALGIPYSESLLEWDKSSDIVLKWQSACPNVRDAPRYAMWFTNAFKSTCFKRSSTSASLEDATEDVKEVAEIEMPFYKEMHETRLTKEFLNNNLMKG